MAPEQPRLRRWVWCSTDSGRRVIVLRETVDVLGAAMRDAQQRGHRPVTVTHVALALLAEPDIAHDLQKAGISLNDLYDDVERLLPPRADSPAQLLSDDVAPALQALLQASCPHGIFAPTPQNVFRALLSSDNEAVRAVLAQHALTAEQWPPAASRSPGVGSGPAIGGEPGPYRGLPNANANANANVDVVFWNDKKTTMEFVTQLLRGTFGVVEPQATRVMLSTDRDGFAVVGTYERHDAERLAETAMRLARERGFPLRVSVEQQGRTKSIGPVARWLHRRSRRSVAHRG